MSPVNCGEAIVGALATHGADTVFGIPGTHTLALYEALADSAVRHVTPHYFATLGTPLVAGRDFDDRDRPESPPVAIVNEAAVRKFFGNATTLEPRHESIRRHTRADNLSSRRSGRRT